MHSAAVDRVIRAHRRRSDREFLNDAVPKR
jgi:hypothetical protein